LDLEPAYWRPLVLYVAGIALASIDPDCLAAPSRGGSDQSVIRESAEHLAGGIDVLSTLKPLGCGLGIVDAMYASRHGCAKSSTSRPMPRERRPGGGSR